MRRPKALVVIADPPGCDDVREALRHAGFDVDIAADAAEAGRRAAVDGADTALLARARPDARGLDAFETLHRSPTEPWAIVGCSAAIERVRFEASRIADSDVTPWLVGPPGAGKELVARAIHAASSRAGAAFVAVACAACGDAEPDGLWSGPAGGGGPSLLEQARGGTLYLDDVCRLSLEAQHGLEGAIADGRVAGAGVRLVAASREDPSRAIEDRRLLRPLHRRIAQATLVLPPLSERSEDVPLLARRFLDEIAEVNGTVALAFEARALERLTGYGWPGEAQELRNAIEHAALLADDGIVRECDLPERIRAGVAPAADGGAAARNGAASFRAAKREVVEAFERTYLRELMRRHAGNVTSASTQAGMLRSALQRLLRKYGLKSAEFRRTRRHAEMQGSTRSTTAPAEVD